MGKEWNRYKAWLKSHEKKTKKKESWYILVTQKDLYRFQSITLKKILNFFFGIVKNMG